MAQIPINQELKGQDKIIAEVRRLVDAWRGFSLGKAEEPYPLEPARYEPNHADEKPVTATTKILLSHWFRGDPHMAANNQYFKYWPHQRRLVETFIYLYEVRGIRRTEELCTLAGVEASWKQRDPWAKLGGQLATGSGKTKMMSLLIAWSYLNAVCEGEEKLGFGRHSVLIAPGLFVRDRLFQDFMPADKSPSVFFSDPVIPPELESSWDLRVYSPATCPMQLDPTEGALVVTNYHQLLRTEEEAAQTTGTRDANTIRDLFESGEPEKLESISSPLLKRFANSRGLLVLNDEAHHVWDETKHAQFEQKTKGSKSGEDEMAWIRSIRRLHGENKSKGRVALQVDLSATLFEEKGSTQTKSKTTSKQASKEFRQVDLFRHTAVQYDLAEAIKDGIVKHPILERVEVRDAKTGEPEPLIRTGTNTWEIYKNILVTGIKRWKKVGEQFKEEGDKRKPILFILCSDRKEAKEIANYLTYGQPIQEDLSHLPPTGYKDPQTKETLFLDKDQDGNPRSTVIEIHIGAKEESNEEEWEKLRQSVNAIDKDEIPDPAGKVDEAGKAIKIANPYNVVISVSMIKEGWDVRNVKVIVPLRPCDSRTLTEQVLGRGLRKMHPPEIDDEGKAEIKKEDLYVIEHPSFKAILEQIKDIIEEKDSDSIKHTPEYVAIEQKPELEVREMHDVRLVRFEGVTPIVSDWRQSFDPKALPNLSPKVGWHSEIAETQIQTYLKEAWAKKEEEGQQFTLPSLPSYRDFDQVIDLAYVIPLLKEMRTTHQHKTAVRNVVKEYLKHKVFNLPVAIDFEAMLEEDSVLSALGNLARPDVIEKVRISLREPLHKAITSNQPTMQARMAERSAAEIQDYQAVKKYVLEDPDKSTFARAAMENDDELKVAILLDKAKDVTGWLYNHRSGVGYAIEYSWQGHSALYYPDFIVRAKLGQVFHNFIIEVKGRLDDKDKAKARRGRDYCDVISEYDTEPWHYLFLVENDALGRKDISWWESRSAHEILDLWRYLISKPLIPDGSSSGQVPILTFEQNPPQADKQKTVFPVYELTTLFEPQSVANWARPHLDKPLDENYFVVQLSGKLMEPAFVDGSWALFRKRSVSNSQQATLLDRKRVLVRVASGKDANAKDGYTIRHWVVAKNAGGVTDIALLPINPSFSKLEFPFGDPDFQVVAEFVGVVG